MQTIKACELQPGDKVLGSHVQLDIETVDVLPEIVRVTYTMPGRFGVATQFYQHDAVLDIQR